MHRFLHGNISITDCLKEERLRSESDISEKGMSGQTIERQVVIMNRIQLVFETEELKHCQSTIPLRLKPRPRTY